MPTPLILALLAALVVIAGVVWLTTVYKPGTSRILDWLRVLLMGLMRREDDRPAPRFATPGGALPPPARPAHAPVPDGGPELAPAPLDVQPGEIPAAAVPFLAWIASQDWDDDTGLLEFTRGMAAFDLAKAEAVDQVHEMCLSPGLRLDPMAVAGMGDYAQEASDTAHTGFAIWRRFVNVYHEIKMFRASGGELPKDGDFITGES